MKKILTIAIFLISVTKQEKFIEDVKKFVVNRPNLETFKNYKEFFNNTNITLCWTEKITIKEYRNKTQEVFKQNGIVVKNSEWFSNTIESSRKETVLFRIINIKNQKEETLCFNIVCKNENVTIFEYENVKCSSSSRFGTEFIEISSKKFQSFNILIFPTVNERYQIKDENFYIYNNGLNTHAIESSEFPNYYLNNPDEIVLKSGNGIESYSTTVNYPNSYTVPDSSPSYSSTNSTYVLHPKHPSPTPSSSSSVDISTTSKTVLGTLQEVNETLQYDVTKRTNGNRNEEMNVLLQALIHQLNGNEIDKGPNLNEEPKSIPLRWNRYEARSDKFNFN